MFEFTFKGPFMIFRKESTTEEDISSKNIAEDFLEDGLIPFCFFKDKKSDLFKDCAKDLNSDEELVKVLAVLDYGGRYYA